MNHSIATVIHFCTNEYRFLAKVVEEAKKFSRLIVIPICDHFFNGQPENRALLERIYREFPDCQFIEFAYYSDHLYNPYITSFSIEDREWGFFWHSTSRYIAALFMPPEIEHVLFLDSDEVIDGKRFRQWLDKGEYLAYSAVRFRCYLYVHQPYLRANHLFNSALFARLDALDPLRIINAEDRHGQFKFYPEPKLERLVDENGVPFIHHYPWVRTQDECMRKSETWGHRLDKDWRPAIERMFQNSQDSELMDLNLTFEKVEVYFDPLSVSVFTGAVSTAVGSNVLKVDERAVRRREIERLL